MAASIVTNKLSKRYPGTKLLALRELSISITAGEVYGFLGANGAGKSTTIRTLLNFIQPTAGSASICGFDIVTNGIQARQQVGYLSGDVALYQKATGHELLDYLAQLQGGVDPLYRQRLEKRFQADLDKPISTLSKGNRQKLGILQALMHQPAVLILDEPTSGLDPLMQEAFYDSLREARDRGAAVLMSSHNLAEAQRVCDRIGIIKHGALIHEQIIADDTELSKANFRVGLATAADMAQLQKAAHLHFISKANDTTALVQPATTIAAALKALSQFDIRELTTEQLNLEDEFIEFYGDNQ